MTDSKPTRPPQLQSPASAKSSASQNQHQNQHQNQNQSANAEKNGEIRKPIHSQPLDNGEHKSSTSIMPLEPVLVGIKVPAPVVPTANQKQNPNPIQLASENSRREKENSKSSKNASKSNGNAAGQPKGNAPNKQVHNKPVSVHQQNSVLSKSQPSNSESKSNPDTDSSHSNGTATISPELVAAGKKSKNKRSKPARLDLNSASGSAKSAPVGHENPQNHKNGNSNKQTEIQVNVTSPNSFPPLPSTHAVASDSKPKPQQSAWQKNNSNANLNTQIQSESQPKPQNQTQSQPQPQSQSQLIASDDKLPSQSKPPKHKNSSNGSQMQNSSNSNGSAGSGSASASASVASSSSSGSGSSGRQSKHLNGKYKNSKYSDQSNKNSNTKSNGATPAAANSNSTQNSNSNQLKPIKNGNYSNSNGHADSSANASEEADSNSASSVFSSRSLGSPSAGLISMLSSDVFNSSSGRKFSPLHQEIVQVARLMGPRTQDGNARRQVMDKVANVIFALWDSVEVHVIGSCATDLFLPDSDLDLVVRNPKSKPPLSIKDLYVLGGALGPLASSLNIISTASVPLIKLTDKDSSYTVDITLNIDTGLYSTLLIFKYLAKFPALRLLTITLKQFLKTRGLNELYSGGLPSYTLILMIVAFLQFYRPAAAISAVDDERELAKKIMDKGTASQGSASNSPILRGLSADSAKAEEEAITEEKIAELNRMKKANASIPVDAEPDLGHYLLAFFEFYGKTFPFSSVGISLRDGGSFFSKRSRKWLHSHNPELLCLENPLVETNDLGFKVFRINEIRQSFAAAFDLLANNAVNQMRPAGESQQSSRTNSDSANVSVAQSLFIRPPIAAASINSNSGLFHPAPIPGSAILTQLPRPISPRAPIAGFNHLSMKPGFANGKSHHHQQQQHIIGAEEWNNQLDAESGKKGVESAQMNGESRTPNMNSHSHTPPIQPVPVSSSPYSIPLVAPAWFPASNAAFESFDPQNPQSAQARHNQGNYFEQPPIQILRLSAMQTNGPESATPYFAGATNYNTANGNNFVPFPYAIPQSYPNHGAAIYYHANNHQSTQSQPPPHSPIPAGYYVSGPIPFRSLEPMRIAQFRSFEQSNAAAATEEFSQTNQQEANGTEFIGSEIIEPNTDSKTQDHQPQHDSAEEFHDRPTPTESIPS